MFPGLLARGFNVFPGMFLTIPTKGGTIMTDTKTKQSKAFGSWKSPITADMISKGVVSFKDLVVDGDDIYWVESRPKEEGRYVVMRY